jgi:hypothetical protein
VNDLAKDVKVVLSNNQKTEANFQKMEGDFRTLKEEVKQEVQSLQQGVQDIKVGPAAAARRGRPPLLPAHRACPVPCACAWNGCSRLVR